jgi:hypothetical protein
MLSENLLTAEQQTAIDYIYERDASILVAPTGEGKSVICLTAIAARVADMPHCQTLIVCPPKVVPVHKKEARKWEHLQHLKIVEVVGDPEERQECLRGNADADAYVISLNNLEWLLDSGLLPGAVNGVIIDELSTAAGKQTRKLRHKKWVNRITWRVGMTATPVSHDFRKVFNMARLVAGVKVFGNNEQAFLDQYFFPDFSGYKWTIRDGAAEIILDRLVPYVHLIEDRKAEKLPTLTERLARFDMPEDTRELYDEMAADLLLGGLGIEAANEAVKSGKLRQIGSGFIYDESGEVQRVDTARQEAFLREIAGPSPVLVFYEYEAQKAEILWAGESVAFSMAEFDPKKHHVLAVQIRSLSHGVDGLQHLFHRVLFYMPVWSRDAYHQARDRVWRQGQKKPVDVVTLFCDDTLDDLVMTRVEERAQWMRIFTNYLKKRRG